MFRHVTIPGALWFLAALAGLFVPAGNAKPLDGRQLNELRDLPSGGDNHGFDLGAVFPTTDAAALSKWSETRGSFIESDRSTGKYESPWFTAADPVVMGVAGYPSVEHNRLELELLLTDDTRRVLPFPDKDPGEVILYWGSASSGVTREAGQVIFLALAGVIGWGWGVAQAARLQWIVRLFHSVPFLGVRIIPVLVMAFAASVERAPWWLNGRWRVNDAVSLGVAFVFLSLIAVQLRREERRRLLDAA